ncbi:MAG: hypothetical protein CM1200mP22_30450 [Dehalococcoidia bacterium]|nr:MAG: hypothetical protein CM1200mP22_30450 [Dehalococcoidia bacterium]
MGVNQTVPSWPGSPWGCLSVFLAKQGFTGAENVFAGQYGFFPMYQEGGYDLSEITKNLGDEFLGDQISLKPYPCGRPPTDI